MEHAESDEFVLASKKIKETELLAALKQLTQEYKTAAPIMYSSE